MEKEKQCNRKYASEKIQKWHKTDIVIESDKSGVSIKCRM